MPNDCWNRITITCENIEFTEELNNLIINELKHKEDDKYVYEWLDGLLDKYPNCWIKNEWSEEGGFAGVWIGFVKDNEKIIKQLTWDDICLEGKHCLFTLEDEEEEKKEQEERQNKINRNKNRINNTNKRIFKSK